MIRAWSLALMLAAAGASPAAAQTRPGPLTIDLLTDIKHPSSGVWSPDGRLAAFLWDRGGAQNVWVTRADDGEPTALTAFASDLIEALDWSPDGEALLFIRGGLLMQVSRRGGAPRPVWPGAASISDVAFSPDHTRLAFVRKGELYVRGVTEAAEVRLATAVTDVAGPTWSPDGSRIAFTFGTSRTVEEATPYAGSKVVFTRVDRGPRRVGTVPAAGGTVTDFPLAPGGEESPRWLDSNRVVVQRMAADLRGREVVVADARTGTERVLHRDTDSKFWSLTFLIAEPIPSPDGKGVAFVSDRDGWDHLYVAPADGGPAVQVTHGRFEVARFSWSPDSTRIVFDRNEPDRPGTRHVAVAEFSSTGNPARIVTITSGRGTNTNARWSPDGRRLLYEHTDGRNSADYYVATAGPGASPRRLTDSMPAAIDRRALVEPEFVNYRAPDGAQVPAYLFVPPGLDRSHPHPAIVWVHGDGINQNYDGWHIHRDYGVYYSFHQYLVQQGYVVLSVDYRGSIGYGRDWRQGHYRDLGGRDYADIAAGAEYLKRLGFVDGRRIGIWGLSYGGFMALQALTVTPGLFRCAIDVAGVGDWNDWYRDPGGPWIRARMGAPEQDPELYRKLSPIYHVEKIRDPLLVLHGTSDVNVPFLESVRLIDALTKAGKAVELRMYPGEFHYFQRAHVLRDAWLAAERFFAEHLQTR